MLQLQILDENCLDQMLVLSDVNRPTSFLITQGKLSRQPIKVEKSTFFAD